MINVYYFPRLDLREQHILLDLQNIHKYTFGNNLKVYSSHAINPNASWNVCVDTGHCLPGIPSSKVRTAFWCMHCHSKKHQMFAKKFQVTFGVDKFYVDKKLFNHWLPNGVGMFGIKKISKKEKIKYDLGFVGQYFGSRGRVLGQIQKICDRRGWSYNFVDTHKNATGKKEPCIKRPNWVTSKKFNELLSECRVIVNVTGHPKWHLLNCRIFEGIAHNKPVFSDIVIGAKELVKDGHGVVYFDYENLKDIEEKLEKLLSDFSFFTSVVALGKKEFEKHTIFARFRQLFKTLGVNIT